MDIVAQLYWLFDLILAILLVLLAMVSLASKNLFKSIVFFITFGLMLTLILVRLNAPDVAMAEAAIGAGVTGALLLTALRNLKDIETIDELYDKPKFKILVISLIIILSTIIFYAIFSLPNTDIGLQAVVEKNLGSSGVINPVTAVLLNFRAYDTLLEIFVLLSAILGVFTLGSTKAIQEFKVNPILETLISILIPILILASGYILWIGASAPGGAFQAGSILGSAGVLYHLLGKGQVLFQKQIILKISLIIGPFLFTAVAILTALFETSILKYPFEHAGVIILLLESFGTISIAVTLTLLYHTVFLEKKGYS